ncbi:MAG: hypothetical protein H0U73_02390 [Tatlockia sp.]|nr:hypothetical protein [Tatlockia sp.]
MISFDEKLDELHNEFNKEEFLSKLRAEAMAQGGISSLSKKTNLNREKLYTLLSKDGNPTLNSLLLILRALHFQLAINPINHQGILMHIYIDTSSLIEIYQYDLETIERLQELLAFRKKGKVSIWFSDKAQIEFNDLRNANPAIHENGWMTNYYLANSLIAELLLNSEKVYNNNVEDFVIEALAEGKRVGVVSIDDEKLTRNWNREKTEGVKFYPELKRLFSSFPIAIPD